ncbi:DUF4352 domain-containing protein [Nocardiopsis exhalans]|uniref:DUF4352 domain-containing protein n=1 Tax=Nocardiopsis exhalans TaxID=163604 RepID=A0ABY5DF01_9ACTN|nr:DUF4352 domain-containing protein [Nocardiopsis exhalans]USY22582.1 DUF4352 domain-containing protein [Nocardiopsis exhalans]
MDRTVWIVAASAVTVALALVFGFGAGWFSHQQYLRDSIESAFEDLDAGEPEQESPAEPADAPDEEATEPDQPEDSEETDRWPEAAPMGESASDGTWDITLTGVERTTHISGSYSNTTAAAGREFVVLEAELTNASSGPQAPDVEDCELVDTDGNRHAYDFDALLVLDEQNDVLYYDVNPGASVTVSVPFDVAEGADVEVALMTGVWDGPGVAELAVEE